MSNFVHLHLHSQYSLLDGAIKIKDLVEKAKELNMPAVAVTDHGNMFGSYELYKTAKEAGIKPLIGQEFYVAPRSRFEKEKDKDKEPFHLVLIAKNQEGLKNLIKLSSLGFIEGFYYRPRIDKELLAKYSKGLICLSACVQGEIPYYLIRGEEEKAYKAAKFFKEIFGDDFYLEVQNHGLDEEKKANEKIFELAKKLDIKVVATNDAHYIEKEDADAHEILLCIQTKSTIDNPRRFKFPNKEFYFKTDKEMQELFVGYPQVITNTLEVAEKVDENIKMGSDTYLLPKYQVPKGETFDSYLRKLAFEGLEKRLKQTYKKLVKRLDLLKSGKVKKDPYLIEREIQEIKEKLNNWDKVKEKYVKRLEYELSTIKQMGFSAYFLIVWDFINWAKKNGIPVGPGRGSVGGSLVAYAIGITDIDPIFYGLLFERFLNPERVTMPDIDVDFCFEKREKVIDYVREKYGKKNVGQIITFSTLKPRGVVRDVARVMGVPPKEYDKLAKLVPDKAKSIEEALEESADLKELYQKDSKVKKILDYAKKLCGLVRQTGVHAAGVVIAPDELTKFVPLARGKDNVITTQYDMGQLEELGLLKMDFLGLKTLTFIDKTIQMIFENRKIKIDINEIPLDDEKTYELLKKGNTIGVFQLESSGMRNLLKRLKPENIFDVVALVALYRPGPLNSGMVDSYIKRKHGEEKIDYIFDELKDVLKETYGIIVYQEQIMAIANVLCGYSLGEADLLRRAVAKKKADLMATLKNDFIERAVKRGFDKEKVTKLWEDIEKFAEYCFNKSHSAAYGYIAYITAYLKAHFPEEFYAAIMSLEVDKAEEVAKYIKDARENGIEVLPPDINKSYSDFVVENGKIRVGLAGLKGVGSKAAEEIIKVRKEKGEFKDLFDFCMKVDLRSINKKVIETLIKAGAFDYTGISRRELLESLEKIMAEAQNRKKSREAGLLSLFGEEIEENYSYPYKGLKEWDEIEKLEYERQAVGFYVSAHPIDIYKEFLPKDITFVEELLNLKDGDEIKLVGAITKVDTKISQRGERYALVEITDPTGVIQATVFPKVFKENEHLLTEGNLVYIKGVINKDRESEEIRLTIKEIKRFFDIFEDENCLFKVIIPLKDENYLKFVSQKLKELSKEESSLRKIPVVEVIDKDYIYALEPNYDIPIKAETLKALKEFGKVKFVHRKS